MQHKTLHFTRVFNNLCISIFIKHFWFLTVLSVSTDDLHGCKHHSCYFDNTRVKLGKFGQLAEFGQRSCLFHILVIGIKTN